MRPSIFIPLLVLTHGLAIWGGLALRGRLAERSPMPAASLPTADEAKLTLHRFIEPKAIDETASPGERAEWEAQVIAARQAIPADAAVAVMVQAMAATVDKDYDSLRAEAAYLGWIERDVLAAVGWRAAWEPDSERFRDHFRTGMVIYFRDKDIGEAKRLRDAAPEARSPILMGAATVAKESGMDAVGQLAVSLEDPAEVLWVLEMGLYRTTGSHSAEALQELAPHLPAIRRLLGDGRGLSFLNDLGRHEEAGALRDAVVAAGFSEAALEGFDRRAKFSTRRKLEKEIPLAERIRTQMADKHWGPSSLRRALAWEVTGFEDWCGDFGDSRLSAAEVFAKLEAAVPGSNSIRGEMRELLLGELLPLNATAAVEWLRREPGWQGVLAGALKGSLRDVSPESLYRLAEAMSPPELESSGVRLAVAERFADWADDDHTSCMAAVENLPSGPLKERIRGEIGMKRQMRLMFEVWEQQEEKKLRKK